MTSEKRISSFEHTLKDWEIKYGYIYVAPEKNWREFFSSLIGEKFDITVFGKKLKQKMDKLGRIYVGPAAMKGLKKGDIIVCSRDSKGNYSFEKKG